MGAHRGHKPVAEVGRVTPCAPSAGRWRANISPRSSGAQRTARPCSPYLEAHGKASTRFHARMGAMDRLPSESSRERFGLRRWSLRNRRFRMERKSGQPWGVRSLASTEAKAVTSPTPSPQSKTWRQCEQFMEKRGRRMGYLACFERTSKDCIWFSCSFFDWLC